MIEYFVLLRRRRLTDQLTGDDDVNEAATDIHNIIRQHSTRNILLYINVNRMLRDGSGETVRRRSVVRLDPLTYICYTSLTPRAAPTTDGGGP